MDPQRFAEGLYVSLEQMRGEEPDHCSDLYSLGLVLAEALSANHSFTANLSMRFIACTSGGSWTLPDELQENIPATRLLTAVDPKALMPSAYELSGSLAALGFERPRVSAALNSNVNKASQPTHSALIVGDHAQHKMALLSLRQLKLEDSYRIHRDSLTCRHIGTVSPTLCRIKCSFTQEWRTTDHADGSNVAFAVHICL
jgi:serine/threonine protein kinase